MGMRWYPDLRTYAHKKPISSRSILEIADDRP